MSIIKTNLHTASTDDQGNISLYGNKAFSGVFALGLILGSQDPHTKQFPTDEKGLQDMKEQLDHMAFDCFSGLAGIGALIAAANPQHLVDTDFTHIGYAINNLALLGLEIQNHAENIDIDMNHRNRDQPDREQAAIHSDLHKAAKVCQANNPSFSYFDALALSAARKAGKEAI